MVAVRCGFKNRRFVVILRSSVEAAVDLDVVKVRFKNRRFVANSCPILKALSTWKLIFPGPFQGGWH